MCWRWWSIKWFFWKNAFPHSQTWLLMVQPPFGWRLLCNKRPCLAAKPLPQWPQKCDFGFCWVGWMWVTTVCCWAAAAACCCCWTWAWAWLTVTCWVCCCWTTGWWTIWTCSYFIWGCVWTCWIVCCWWAGELWASVACVVITCPFAEINCTGSGEVGTVLLAETTVARRKLILI